MPSVLIQAGHQGQVRNSGSGTAPSYGTGGLPEQGDEEYLLTPIVADAAKAWIDAFDVNEEIIVIREDAFFDKEYTVDLGVAVHFDGSGTPCASGASIGYPTGSPPGSNQPTAERWKALWGSFWPFKWMPDNFTAALRGYYGYSWMQTNIAEFLIEVGELTCPEQNEWLRQPGRLEWIGSLLGYFIAKELSVDSVPMPSEWHPNWTQGGDMQSSFADVSEDNIFKDDIEWLYATGITRGAGTDPATGKPLFKPKDPVTREQMAAFLHRMANAQALV